ncbi:hypothetical protein AB0L02_22940 [Streptomyces anulatus]|uniref:hypothetical protein n=1 Tax=Streptomyces anulatus TaxID=1892 RepID=UPI00342B3DB8
MKVPKRLMTDEDAVRRLMGHTYFRPHKTPIQLLNRATDPMLPVVKPHVFNVLRQLDDLGMTNHVLVITRWRVTPEDCAVLYSFTHLRLTVLVTHSNIQDTEIDRWTARSPPRVCAPSTSTQSAIALSCTGAPSCPV